MKTLMTALMLIGATSLALAEPGAAPPTGRPQYQSTADHSRFKELQKTFKSGPEVTAACLICHTEAAKQLQKTKHWTWDVVNTQTRQQLGKRRLINNYCTSTLSNEKDCMACHAGYGWADGSFDMTKQENVDCLVCHDTSGTYRKLPGYAGHPVYKDVEFPPGSGKIVKAVDLTKVAQGVGRTSRQTCGACHFYGGGADGAKHGDLDSAMKNPGKYLDVHMDKAGLNFSCDTCHEASGHVILGSRYSLEAAPTGPAQVRGTHAAQSSSCQSCHGNRPHPAKDAKLNEHTDKLACQTCHIPEFARDNVGTELYWDWSTATKLGPDGKPYQVKDPAGRRAFDSKRGSFVWDSYVTPQYRWFNGSFVYKGVGDKIDPSRTTVINQPGGSPNDPESRIWPFKSHRGNQPYDKVNLVLAVSHNGGEDDAALWRNFDWQKALTAGMEKAGLPYSGQYGFAQTEMLWPITHMVAPKDDALKCEQCHAQEGRLAGIEGIYLPGRDRLPLLDLAGWLLASLTLLGVLVHGGLRIYTSRKH
jgi:octaheme c-type cytochrome (tetrathionate reductase family)